MLRLLIFGGTTEGRELAEYCAALGIHADISVATEYGAELLPEGVGILAGRMDCEAMTVLIAEGRYSIVVDATHPYAAEATENIKLACEMAGVERLRLIRSSSALHGTSASNVEKAVELIRGTGKTVLSTLGSKSVEALSVIPDRYERIWLRLLPADGITDRCRTLGFDTEKLILERGPFTVEQNIAHIRVSQAELLLTKESGAVGGYPEKAEAAEKCGTELITVLRPEDSGCSYDELKDMIRRRLEEER